MKGKIKILFADMLTLCLAIAAFSFAAIADDGSFDADYVRNRVAFVGSYTDAYYGNEEEGYTEYGLIGGSGTCFFIGEEEGDPEYLVTNYHVIENYVEGGKGEATELSEEIQGTYSLPELSDNNHWIGTSAIYVYFDQNAYEEAYPVVTDEIKDIAILRLNRPTDQREAFRLRTASESDQGKSVWAIGFPDISDNYTVNPVSKRSKSDVTISKGSLNKLLTMSGTGVRVLQIDANIYAGNSGGPLVDENNTVIGIDTFTISRDDGEKVNYAINIIELKEMLDRNGIAYVIDEPVSPTEPVSTTEEETTTETETTTEPEPPDVDTNYTLYIILGVVGGIVLLAVIVSLVIVLRRKKKKSNEKIITIGGDDVNLVDYPPRKHVPTPAIRCMSPQHQGKSVTLKDRQLVIGWDSNVCSIVFKGGTPGVSGKHCAISYDEKTQDFILTDLKSRYGTFLANGRKLEPGEPCRLRKGDSFYLGEEKNKFIVDIVDLK